MFSQILRLTILGSLLFSSSVALADEQWITVVTNEVGDRFLVDRNSIQMRENIAWYWEYREFRQPNNAFVETEVAEPVYGVMMYQSVDCTSGVVRLRRLNVYGTDRQVLNRFDYGDTGSLSQPVPGSSAAAVIQLVCQPDQANPNNPSTES